MQPVVITSSDVVPSERRQQRMRAAIAAIDPGLVLVVDRHGCRLLAPPHYRLQPVREPVTQRAATAFWRELRARKPAGRPRSSELTAHLNIVRCTPGQRQAFERLGGAAWLREQLDAATR